MKQLDLLMKEIVARTAEAARLRAERNSAVKAAQAYAARLRAEHKGEGWTAALIYGCLPGAVTFDGDGGIASFLGEDPIVFPNVGVLGNTQIVEARWFDGWVDLS